MDYSVNDYYAKSSDSFESKEVKLPVILINDVAKILFENIEQSKEDGASLSKSEKIILMYLSENPAVTQLDISRATHLQPPTVSLKLKKLEAEGYIFRTTDHYDRRAVRVYLSEKGNSLYKNSSDQSSYKQQKILEGISREDIMTLTAILNKIIENSKS